MKDETRMTRNYVLCIDPGHPSETNAGDTPLNGTTEAAVNWAVAKALEAELACVGGLKVVLTREKFGEVTTNRMRAEIANAAGASLMLRLHCDNGSGRGIAFYYPDRQGRKNGDVGPTQAVIDASRRAAMIMNAAAEKTLGGELRINGVRGDSATMIGRKQGALTGSIYSRVPVVTVEMVYLNDEKDAAFIKSARGMALMVKALARGAADCLEASR